MEVYDLRLEPLADLSKAEKIIEECSSRAELQLKFMGTLSTYPKSLHWHIKKANLPGTLELTLYKKEGRVWFSVQSRRKGEWIEESMKKLKRAIEENLNNPS